MEMTFQISRDSTRPLKNTNLVSRRRNKVEVEEIIDTVFETIKSNILSFLDSLGYQPNPTTPEFPEGILNSRPPTPTALIAIQCHSNILTFHLPIMVHNTRLFMSNSRRIGSSSWRRTISTKPSTLLRNR